MDETKKCKHCQSDIPKKAKVCPNCRKKQKGGIGKWILIGFIVIVIIGAVAGGNSSDDASDSNPKKVDTASTVDTSSNTDSTKEETTSSDTKEEVSEAAEEQPVSNEFRVGDTVETSNLRISFLSADEYVSDNQFLQPKDGYMYYRVEFEFENIGSSDEALSSMLSWGCYADGYAMDQSYIGDDILDATISSGKKAKGALYFEVPVDAEEIIIEYETNFWTENKIEFIAK